MEGNQILPVQNFSRILKKTKFLFDTEFEVNQEGNRTNIAVGKLIFGLKI